MITSIRILASSFQQSLELSNTNATKIAINCDSVIQKGYQSFDIVITFSKPIVSFRNHDYAWVDLKKDRVANSFCPKIIQLDQNVFVQANTTAGIWEVNKKQSNQLIWRFNPNFSNGITQYNGKENTKVIDAANSIISFVESPALLFTNQPLEISRSKIPFSAIACFTDHCDYDTPENLEIQRLFFDQLALKTTKGFFLNHYSKREDNASFENNAEAIARWRENGHELAYHSLSQSIKSDEESRHDFESFQPPYTDIKVWIDHGFQPYNFSLFQNNNWKSNEYEMVLQQKNITTLWNYIDAGTATKGVINQLNAEQFTMQSFTSAIKSFSLKSQMVLLFKNIIFHYDNHPKRIRNYIDAVANVRAIIQKKKIQAVWSLLLNILPLVGMVTKVLIMWNAVKNKPYKVAKFSPLLFQHTIDQHQFYIFQTLEMVDFKMALESKNIDSLISESGVFIAHTYFSVNMEHYSGKLFKNKTQLDEEVVRNFEYLANKIHDKKVWNPTLSELISYWNDYQNTIFDINSQGQIVQKNNQQISSRKAV